MIELARREGRPLRIAHRGAPRVAPENTIESFRAAVALGVDLIELDVVDPTRGRGPVVVAHSTELAEITHGAVQGTAAGMPFERLRELAPALPTFAETLAWLASEAPGVGLQVDLKLHGRFEEVADLVDEHGLAERTLVSGTTLPGLRAVGARCPRIRAGLTYPEDKRGYSRRRALKPLVRPGLAGMRTALPRRVGGLLRAAGATALVLEHRVVSPAAVAAAHAAGAPVLAWTVDTPDDLERVTAAGVDGVITNDPTIFAVLDVATLKP